MGKLPVLNSRDVEQALVSLGWVFQRQRGSHRIFTLEGSFVSISVPDHSPVAKGTLRRIIRDAGVDVDTFVKATRK
jgi:predicted RNA binding protein YcfA (HicA-like mRNA interferase family)